MFKLLWLLLIPSVVWADLTWTFTKPVTRSDGEVLAPSEIGGYQVWLDSVMKTTPLSGAAESVRLSGLLNGNHCLMLRTVDTDGRVSSDSNTSCKDETAGLPPPIPAPVTPQVPTDKWSVLYVDSEELVNWYMPARFAFNRGDATENELWHTQYQNGEPPYPHEIQLGMGGLYHIEAFQQKPRVGGGNGTVKGYEFYTSMDGKNWTPAAVGEFSAGDAIQTVPITPVDARYFKFVATSAQGGENVAAVDELFAMGNELADLMPPGPPTQMR